MYQCEGYHPQDTAREIQEFRAESERQAALDLGQAGAAMMTVREINAHVRRNGYVTASYEVCGVPTYGRIIRARMRQGQMEGLVLSIGQWFAITGPQTVK